MYWRLLRGCKTDFCYNGFSFKFFDFNRTKRSSLSGIWEIPIRKSSNENRKTEQVKHPRGQRAAAVAGQPKNRVLIPGFEIKGAEALWANRLTKNGFDTEFNFWKVSAAITRSPTVKFGWIISKSLGWSKNSWQTRCNDSDSKWSIFKLILSFWTLTANVKLSILKDELNLPLLKVL